MSQGQGQEKTEQPTAKRLKDARKKGQVARSRDLALAAASVAATVALAKLGGRLIGGLADRLGSDLAHFGDAPLKVLAAGDITLAVMRSVGLMALLVGPIALATMTAGVVMHGFQGGWLFAPEALHLNWNKLSPSNGMQKFKLMQSGMETIKTMGSVAVITCIAWVILRSAMDESVRMAWLSPLGSSMLAWEHADQLLWRVAWALGILALGDYGLQKYRLTTQLKMSKQEVKDEHKMMEGDPAVKRKIRQAQMAMTRNRMLADVARASVVITNPTHFAVALEYRRAEMFAPRVLAKGTGHLALKIRERARSHGVPIVENRPLAQALFKTGEVGQTIPAPLFGAVAEVLAYLVRIKQLML